MTLGTWQLATNHPVPGHKWGHAWHTLVQLGSDQPRSCGTHWSIRPLGMTVQFLVMLS